jgi:hypothetical protein
MQQPKKIKAKEPVNMFYTEEGCCRNEKNSKNYKN